MNRRSFLKKIGKIGAVALIAPKVLVAGNPTFNTTGRHPWTCIEGGVSPEKYPPVNHYDDNGFGLAPIKKEGELVIEDRYEYLMSQGWVNHSGVFGWNGT